MEPDVPLAERTELVPRSTRSALVPSRQLDLALDHARLRGMTPTDRRTLIAQLARLLLEARGIVTREVGDDHP
jgi:hypothetical protein